MKTIIQNKNALRTSPHPQYTNLKHIFVRAGHGCAATSSIRARVHKIFILQVNSENFPLI